MSNLLVRHIRTAAMAVYARAIGGRMQDVQFVGPHASKPNLLFDADEDELEKMLATWAAGDFAVRRIDKSTPLTPVVCQALQKCCEGMSQHEREVTILDYHNRIVSVLRDKWPVVVALAKEMQIHQEQRQLPRLTWQRMESIMEGAE